MKKRTFAIEVELPPFQEDSGIVYTADFVDFLKPEVVKRFVPEPAWILERYIAFSDNQARERRKLLQEKLKAIKASKGSSQRPSSKTKDLPPKSFEVSPARQPSPGFGNEPPSDGQTLSTKDPGNDSKKANVATGARKP
ncbi:MAG: hypothetical protein RIR25_1599 [Verrucomicrobiota bacterium]